MTYCSRYAETSWGCDDALFAEGWERAERRTQPNSIYNLRASRLHDLRLRLSWANDCADEEFFRAPTKAATAGAEVFINSMADGSLRYSCGIEISHNGEINFIFGSGEELFQIVIDGDGKLSYHGQVGQTEWSGNEIDPVEFPQMQLFTFLSRHQ